MIFMKPIKIYVVGIFLLMFNFIVLGVAYAKSKTMGGAYITSYPVGAAVKLDGEDAGTTPCLIGKVTVGQHTIKLSLPGYHHLFTNIEIKENELKDFNFRLKPMYGSISINTQPSGADVFLNGKYIGRSPRRIEDLLAVNHWVRINQSGYQKWEKEIQLEADQTTSVEVKLEKLAPPDDHHKQGKGDCRTECHDANQAGAMLQISTTPIGATVYIDGNAKGNTPATIHIFPGRHKLLVQKADYKPIEKEIALTSKQEVNYKFELEYEYSVENMVYIPAGEFEMGSTWGAKDEKPAHKIYLDAFYIDKYEVTNKQYRQFVNETNYRQPSYGYDRQWGRDELPIIGVSYDDALAYATWAGKRLPTEAEWEKAAKGTEQKRYPWGNEWQDRSANTIEEARKVTLKGGTYPDGISPYGAHDMFGNVAEWCSDWYSAAYYLNSPPKNPKGPEKGRTRIIRGGSWNDRGKEIGITTRRSIPPQVRLNSVGFRCAKDAAH